MLTGESKWRTYICSLYYSSNFSAILNFFQYKRLGRDFPSGPVWLGLHAPNEEGPGLFPGQGTRSHMATTKIRHNHK